VGRLGVDDDGISAHIHHMMNNSPAIVLDRLRVLRGGRVVLDDVSLEVARGSVTGLLGPSGCGKSTLMRSIVGVQVMAGGSVDVLGNPAGSASLRRQVGYVTQAPSVYADLTVRENLRYFAAVLDAPRSDVDRVIDEVGLGSHADAVVGRLSGGQEARVSLAAALLGEPELLVLDEPTVGLDPVLRRDLWALFRGLAARGTTLLVSSHVMDEAAQCDRLLLMREGSLLADDTLQGLLDRTGTSDVETAFLTLVDRAAQGGTPGTADVRDDQTSGSLA
jgi:ABC-2 type transport system ATP-binding protein